MILTRENLINFKQEPQTYCSEKLRGEIVYRPATVADRMRARSLATQAGELKPELLEAALIVTCCIEPRFGEADLDFIMQLPSNEIQKIANLILNGVSANP